MIYYQNLMKNKNKKKFQYSKHVSYFLGFSLTLTLIDHPLFHLCVVIFQPKFSIKKIHLFILWIIFDAQINKYYIVQSFVI